MALPLFTRNSRWTKCYFEPKQEIMGGIRAAGGEEAGC